MAIGGSISWIPFYLHLCLLRNYIGTNRHAVKNFVMIIILRTFTLYNNGWIPCNCQTLSGAITWEFSFKWDFSWSSCSFKSGCNVLLWKYVFFTISTHARKHKSCDELKLCFGFTSIKYHFHAFIFVVAF